jgi:ribosomal protein L37AE/L43A
MSDRGEAAPQAQFRCDFCGAKVPRVRRIALDRDYDRLQTPHRVQYACPECSERKERERVERPS